MQQQPQVVMQPMYAPPQQYRPNNYPAARRR